MKKISLLTLLIDLTLLAIIVAVGWFLIGYYLKGEYLFTSYQDWIYHAWRVKILVLYGRMPSWDHIWSNGLNHWRSYQFLQHWVVFLIYKVLHLTITKAMLLVTVLIFVILRVSIYIILRRIGIHSAIAFLATILSFVYIQQWVAIGDFSIFMAIIIVPVYMSLWVNIYKKYALTRGISLKNRMVAEATLASISGALWIVHPVVANAIGGLFFFSIGMRAIKIHWGYFLKILSFYLLGALPFLLPYLLGGYHFSNPIFLSPTFVRDTIAGNFFGLGGYFVWFIGFSWLLIVFAFREVPAWSKNIIVYSTLYILLIYFAKLGYIPSFVLQFQISRVIPVLALFIVFAFAGALNGALKDKNNKLSKAAISIMLIVGAIGISQGIELATTFTGQPVKSMDDPVAIYFNDKGIQKGSIYVKDVSSASYFGRNGLRFVNSYNEHLLPSPLSVRFSSFMRSEIAYTGISKTQIDLINNYTKVLGVEFMVLPETSPLIKELTKEKSEGANFELYDMVRSQKGTFAILHNKQPFNYVYIPEDAHNKVLTWSDHITRPTLQIGSYKEWDDSIQTFAEQIDDGQIKPFSHLEFIGTNKLFIPVDNLSALAGKKIIIAQSYDKNWRINNSRRGISPSHTRFIVLDPGHLGESALRTYNNQRGLLLYNKWPIWHWPLQFFGILLIGAMFVLVIIKPRIIFDNKF